MTAISEWSFHRMLFSGDLDHLDFPAFAADLGFDALEYSNHFFRRTDWRYLEKLKRKTESAGVSPRLLMVDGCGFLGGEPDDDTCTRFTRWMWVAKHLGCKAMRVMIRHPDGEQLEPTVRSMTNLLGWASELPMQIVVENHGGESSNPTWLTDLFLRVPSLQLFSDFGNWGERNPYQATRSLLPYTWGCSGKYDDSSVDFGKMRDLRAPKPSVEWEGSWLNEKEGALRALSVIESLWTTASTPSPPLPLCETGGPS